MHLFSLYIITILISEKYVSDIKKRNKCKDRKAIIVNQVSMLL